MSEERRTPTPAPRTRSTGGRGSQRPATEEMTSETSGLRRSARRCSDAAPVLPEPVGTKSSRKAAPASGGSMPASTATGTVECNVVCDTPPGARLSAHGGVEKDWGIPRTQETAATYTSRVADYLHGYEEARNTLYRLQEEEREFKALLDTASKKQKTELSAKIKQLKKETKKLEKKRTFILNNSGPFKEKLVNDDRFLEMEREKQRKLRGLQPRVEEEGDVAEANNDELNPPGGLQHLTPYSGLPAGQVAMSSGRGPGRSGDESSTSHQGGALLAQIQLLESPGRLQDLTFGDELPEEAPGGKRKKKTQKTKLQEQVRFVYTPLPEPPGLAAGSAHCVNPISQPGLSSAVDSVQESGESMESSVVVSSAAVCSSSSGADKVSAVRPDSDGGPAMGSKGSGTVGCSLTGGGGSLVPESAARAPAALSIGTAVPLEQRCHRERAAGTRMTSPPKKTGLKPLFCIGAAYPDQRRPGAENSSTDEAEGTSKNRSGATNKQARQASRSLYKGSVTCPVVVAPALVPSDADGTKSAQERTGPASMNEKVNVRVNEGVDASANKNLSGAMNGGLGCGTGGGMGGTSAEIGVNGLGMDYVEEGSGGNVGPGPVAPPAVAAPVRSYANVTAGGRGAPSSSSGSGESNLQQRLLGALRRGERSINVEGREVDLSFWIERHGLSAFREERGGDTVWSLPTAGPGGLRRNVVRLRWRGSDTCPPRSKVVELLLKLGFKAADIYALIHPYGTPEFDISFVRPDGLELFWSNYELVKNEPGWRDFAIQAVSRQNNVKKVTVLTRNESLSCIDIMTWLGRYGEVVEVPKKNRDEYGIWSGAWTFMVKLRRSGNTVTHIPSATFLGRDRIQIFYQGQPKLCHRCGDPTHFSANCTVQKCTLCGEIGHLATSCAEIRCHLCGDLGHPFSRCPRSFVNAVVSPVGVSREVDSAGGTAVGDEGAQGPGKKSKQKTPAQLRRLKKRQRDREIQESQEHQPTGVTSDPVPAASLTAEALGDSELDEEIGKIHKEGDAVSSLSSHGESADEDSGGWAETKRGTRRSKKRGDVRSSPTRQMPKEGTTDLPLIGFSNRFRALRDISSSEEEGEAGGEVPDVVVGLTGDAESSLPGEPMSSGGETGPESEDEENVHNGKMDTSISLKRGKPSSDEEGGGVDGKDGGKKKAV